MSSNIDPYNGAILAITGPTASGKTGKAVAVASLLGGEIISADSRQVYVGMDLGTGKDLQEYAPKGLPSVPYHLIDIRPAGYKYNLQEFLNDYHIARSEISQRGKIPVLCGGTGMYVENALAGVQMPHIEPNPKLRRQLSDKSLEELTAMLATMKTLHNTTDTDTRQRVIRGLEIEEYYRQHPDVAALRDRSVITPHPYVLIALEIDRESRRNLISQRLKKRFNDGMIDEVHKLLKAGVSAENLIYYGLEYKYITLYLTDQITRQEMETGLETAIHQFAKRQMTWLRGMQRRGFKLHWLPAQMDNDEFAAIAAGLLQDKNNEKTSTCRQL